MNTNWQIPIAYYLINGIMAEEKANIIILSLHELHTNGLIIRLLTFDGAANNFSMASELRATLRYPELKPFFIHPSTIQKLHIILDPYYVVKLLRNCLDRNILYEINNQAIKRQYFINLGHLQNESGHHIATNLRNRIVFYSKEKMKVRLAV